MHIGFRITLEDGSTISSHDEMWNEVRGHAHALLPNNDKKWTQYELVTDQGYNVSVNFITGIININGQELLPPWDGMEGPSTEGSKEFVTREEWSINSGLTFFPIAGTRNYSGTGGAVAIKFCGWKTRMGTRVVEFKVGMLENGKAIILV